MDGKQLWFGAKVLLAFVLTLAVGLVSVREFEARQRLQRQNAAVELAAARGHLLQERIDRALSSTYALAAVLRQGGGRFDRFEELASEMLRLYGGIGSLSLAPNAVVRRIVPLAGNEAAVGHDLLADPKRRNEALAAIESRKLTLAGPFTLRQGGVAVIGRLPVFLDGGATGDRFWGFTIALLRIADLLRAAQLDSGAIGDYDFELSRVHADTRRRDVFAHSSARELAAPVSYAFAVPNGQWTLSIEPRDGWDSSAYVRLAETLAVLTLGLLAAAFAYHVFKQPAVLQREVGRRTAELQAANRRLQGEIVERRHAEDALRESEQRFRTMADTVPALIWISDAHRRMVHFNTAWLEFFGRSDEDLLGDGWWSAVHPEDLTASRAAFADAAQAAAPFQVEFRARRQDGVMRWLVVRGAPRRSPEGEFVGFVGSCVDVTDLKEAERVLRASHDELERRVAERTAALTQEIDERKRAETELHAEREKQRQLIGKLEAAQNQLLQSEKMAAIGQLAAGVAHEINNPVGYVQANLGTLREYAAALLALVAAYDEQLAPLLVAHPEARESIAGIKQAADFAYLSGDLPALLDETLDGVQRVRKIVQDLKDFSHVDESVWQVADLHQGLESTLNVVWNELKYKAEVVREYGTLPPVECLASQLNQVFMNLLVNAAQAIEQRGVITLRTGREGEMVWVEVADTGKGIAPENLSRVFEPFFTTKPVGKGTGLGLSLSYSIVRKHGGWIEVSSAPGGGTAFRIWLPLTRPPEPSADTTGHAVPAV